ncbi:toxin-like protein 14 [Stegodyphus dumicola]|uniref:toxin-like protein 14 n=1 Tax=Stegodyphus dumicola TaxID=202533 RepID=UPI0015AFFEF7|nr:toxin-like protein 14 [Stegodyphus dumicola]
MNRLLICSSCVLTVFFLFACCDGYTYMQPIMFGEGECIDDDWISHPVGSVWYDKAQCEQLQCIYQRDVLYILAYGCSAIGYPKECRLVPGRGENYPDCCPDVECPPGIEW